MSGSNIFIVDDDKDFALSLGILLETEGHRVSFAHTGEDAVERLSAEDFDLTLMDVRLPGMNGVESFRAIRREKPGARVLMMTAHSVEQLLEQAVDAGALGVLRKPFSDADVIRALEGAKPAGIVLVADDDPEFGHNLEFLLAERNYAVQRALTGQEALDKATAGDIDVLILDLRLPILSGLEVYRELQQSGNSVPTVLVTGFAAEEQDAIRALERMSVEGCLAKPFAPERLLDMIDAIRRKDRKG